LDALFSLDNDAFILLLSKSLGCRAYILLNLTWTNCNTLKWTELFDPEGGARSVWTAPRVDIKTPSSDSLSFIVCKVQEWGPPQL